MTSTTPKPVAHSPPMAVKSPPPATVVEHHVAATQSVTSPAGTVRSTSAYRSATATTVVPAAPRNGELSRAEKRSLSSSCGRPTASSFSRIDAAQLQRYVLAPTLPDDCRLRVRARPSQDGEELGTVGREDEIFATDKIGDWIRVELPGAFLN